MKRLLVVSGVFSLLLANLALVYAEQENSESSMNNPGLVNSYVDMVEPVATPTEKSEFSAMESDKQSDNRTEKIPSDSFDYIPSSWSEGY